MGAYVALLTIHLHFPESGSLKEKRAELNSVKARLRQKLGASVAEVDHQDTWQRSTLAAALVAGTYTLVEHEADAVERYMVDRFPDGCRIERTLASFEEVWG
ncbi:MAG: DUF503 domain-containing protein [Solirubrobacteraceae bacterium]|nr:DUF503 domain-containing protein [Solirubrobacteraceae bacterium]